MFIQVPALSPSAPLRLCGSHLVRLTDGMCSPRRRRGAEEELGVHFPSVPSVSSVVHPFSFVTTDFTDDADSQGNAHVHASVMR